MKATAILLRWYRSFNVRTLGPADPLPTEPWNTFRDEAFPFVRVPIDRLITTIVGANESGKSHLLAAIAKVISEEGMPGATPDRYEIKDICRYCGFGGLDDGVWPEIGIELLVNPTEATLFASGEQQADAAQTDREETITITIILNGSNSDRYAVAYRNNVEIRAFSREDWRSLAKSSLPQVAILDSNLALPNEVHIDELIDLYKNATPKPVVDPLAVQDLWRQVEPYAGGDGTADAAAVQRVQTIGNTIAKSARTMIETEGELVLQLFSGVLGVKLQALERMRTYTRSEGGYVSWLSDEIDGCPPMVRLMRRNWCERQ